MCVQAHNCITLVMCCLYSAQILHELFGAPNKTSVLYTVEGSGVLAI